MQPHVRPHVVIVGAGFAGLTVARALGKADLRITVIDRRNHHLFQPLLYQVATAALSPANIAAPIRMVLRRNRNTEVLMEEVTGVELAGRRVWMRERMVSYDYLVIATGAGQSYFGHEEWEEAAPGLKSIKDATQIREKILSAFESAEMESDPERRRALLRFVIVGGGPTGVELAGAIAELARYALAKDFQHIQPRATEVILVEAGPRILATFPAELAEKAKRSLDRLGVEVLTQARVQAVDHEGVVISGNRIHARTVIWAAGVEASPAGKWLGAETDRTGRVKVEPDLTFPGHPEVFIIGDTAHVEQDGKPLPGVAPVAMQEGRYVASVIRQRLSGEGIVPIPFRYLDKGNLATVGRSSAVADFSGFKLSGFPAWITWVVVHIFYLIGFRNRILVMIEWAYFYFTFQRGARLIVSERTAHSGMSVADLGKNGRVTKSAEGA